MTRNGNDVTGENHLPLCVAFATLRETLLLTYIHFMCQLATLLFAYMTKALLEQKFVVYI
jgi:hypothetical protein